MDFYVLEAKILTYYKNQHLNQPAFIGMPSPFCFVTIEHELLLPPHPLLTE